MSTYDNYGSRKLAGRAQLAAILVGFAIVPTLGAANRDSLGFFKNYFVTGDYAVAGVGLRGQGVNGLATGTISMNSVPAGADVVAAFLYWQTVETTPVPSGFNGFFRGKAIVGKPVGDPMNAACWSSGGTTGPTGSSGRVYRADVMRYLPIDSVNNVRLPNGAHTVSLRDSGGNGNGNVVFASGASLVVIYRILTPGNPLSAPLRSVVIYDGAFTLSKHSDGLTQTIGGFYQASSGAAARMTQIVGNGQPGDLQTVKVNGIGITANQPIGGQGGPSGRWDNPTFNLDLAPNASTLTTEVTGDSNQICLTFGAIITSTNVTDSDRDGLLDTWETRGLHLNPGTSNTPATFGGCSDYPGEACVNLPQMGAINGKKDVFVEIDWLRGTDHLHQPKMAALTEVANQFKAHGIRMHFDVGSNYQALATGPDFFVVPSAHAQGGEVINESALMCRAEPCAYNVPYSVLSFKKGFSSIKDGNPNLGLPAYFKRNRKDVFHYTVFGHALAGPFNLATGMPLTSEPKTVSGVADRPGGDILITLGLWRSDIPENDQVGSTIVQAGTLMHELGHNLGLLHAGLTRTPQCIPNYPSVMNYLYQTRGLTAADGSTHVDFSSGGLSPLNEGFLSETASLGALPYRLRYYGPVRPSDPPDSAAKLRCDGTPVTGGIPMLRLENTFSGFFDWNHDGLSTPGSFSSDVNFSGQIGDGPNGSPLYRDSNDWANLNLQQVGARSNVNGISTDVGAIELGAIELGAIDLGAIELGAIELGAIDLGAIELGAIELGDVDYDTAILSTVDPPPPASPDCPACGLKATNKIDRITLNWTAPNTGRVNSYNVYRSSTANPTPVFFRSVAAGQAALTMDDVANGTTTLYNTVYTYYVTTLVQVSGKIVESLPSNTASGIVKRLFVTALTPTRLYATPNPAPLFTVTGLDLPAPAAATCTTTATLASPAGTYPITCSGPATTANPLNGITYTNGFLTILPTTTTSFGFTNFNSTEGLTLNGNQIANVGGALRVTSAVWQAASVWYSEPMVLTSGFTTTFQFRATGITQPPADGIVFVVQTGSVNAIGPGGGYLGYDGIPGSLAVEFDTYQNGPPIFNDPNANHVAIQSRGTLPNTSGHGPATLAMNSNPGFNIVDGAVHTVNIVYAAGVMTVKVDGATILSHAVNLASLLGVPANGTVRFGFTSATGESSQSTDILNWSLQTTN